MKLIAPSYYNNFSCIADKCKHSCCIGWEIDIDDQTMEYYKSLSGDFGKRLRDNIEITEDIPHFKLLKDERCPFLNNNNLCDIILELGENNLCQICSDHPRFRNFFNDRTEVGLGLCCEEAARIILTYKEKVKLVEINAKEENKDLSDEEIAFFKLRNDIFTLLQNRTKTIDQRISDIIKSYDIYIPEKTYSNWSDIYLSLERLDDIWTNKLLALKELCSYKEQPDELAYEQLLVYFIYRHLADGLYDGRIKQRIAFAILSLKIIREISCVCGDDITQIARLYSSEIEYSDENIDTLLNIL